MNRNVSIYTACFVNDSTPACMAMRCDTILPRLAKALVFYLSVRCGAHNSVSGHAMVAIF
jgi:hypothetical protein